MSGIVKYWLLAFVIGNIFAQYRELSSISDFFFYGLLGIGLLICIFNAKLIFNETTVKKFSFVFLYLAVMIFYQICFGHFYMNERTWPYILSKTIFCLTLVVSISRFNHFYWKKLFKYIIIIVTILLIYGMLTDNTIINGRRTLGFGNPNSTGAICSFCFGALLLGGYYSKTTRYIILVTLLIGTLLSGSRAAVGVIIVSIIFKIGFNKDSMKYLVGFIIAGGVFFYFFRDNLVGLERFSQSVESEEFTSGRETEREATILMITQSPWTGNGIYSGQSEEAKKISILGSHNAYLDFMKWYGIPISMVLIIGMLYISVKLFLRYFKCKNGLPRMHLFVVIGVLLAANFEAYIWGVNQMITTLFFISFALLENNRKDLTIR